MVDIDKKTWHIEGLITSRVYIERKRNMLISKHINVS